MKAPAENISSNAPVKSLELTLKPAGPSCNLQCKYCYYAEKGALFEEEMPWRMSGTCLETVVRRQLEAAPTGEVTFTWQGGEPLMAGKAFFAEAVALQRRLGGDREIRNRVLTNGTLIDPEWAEFFAREGFLVGVSVDGPEKYHDRFRLRKCGGGSFGDVMRGIDCLRRAGVRFHTVTAVHRGNENHGLEVYAFLRELGAEYLEFSPVVEREANQRARDLGLNLATPPPLRRNLKCQPRVSSWSVTPPGYARFMIEIFERWIRHDIDRVRVEFIEDALRRWSGEESASCVFRPTCGDALTVEHDGSVFACDHFVYPLFRRGSILEQSVGALRWDQEQVKFGESKKRDLPEQCRRCSFLFACHGGCPKHRFARSTEGEPGLNYLCSAYKQLFQHIDPYFQAILRLGQRGKPRTEIMEVLNRLPRAAGY
jgi:uncharacterized protein